MFLKSMELFGFKSFADRTYIKFEPGVTAIVGPNGCGKSNIVDAVKWVVGEKQARSLRGQKMEDIIFSGTDNRKPLSLAEVQLTIDNTYRILDFDADEVSIGRRVFRDGESEYLLNKSTVRLKDIEKLFMDTGIGKSAYSVMEQGRMDLILSTRAEDRRYIFEEAAGISRYKLQKKESLRRLEESSDNLKRIGDLIREIEREKELKARQAERTKEYLVLKERRKECDINLSILKFRAFDRRLKKITADIEKLNQEREDIISRIASTSSENEADEKMHNDTQHQIWELDKRLTEYKVRLDSIDDNVKMHRRSIAEQDERLSDIAKKISDCEERKKGYLDDREKTMFDQSEMKTKSEDGQKTLQEYFDKRNALIDLIHDSRNDIEKNKELIREHEKRLAALREELEVVIRQLILAIDRRKAELADSENERQSVREKFHNLLDAADEALHFAMDSLTKGLADEVLEFIKKIDMTLIREAVTTFESFEDGFRSILFDKTGIHAQKEELDSSINKHMDTLLALRNKNTELEDFIVKKQVEREGIDAEISLIEKDLSKYGEAISHIKKHLHTLNFQITDVERQIKSHKKDTEKTSNVVETLLSEIGEWEKRIAEFNEKSELLVKEHGELVLKQNGITKRIHDRKNVSVMDEENLAKAVERITALDKSTVELSFQKNGLEEYLWTEYETKAADSENIVIEESETVIGEKLQALRREIQPLEQQINPLAIEEFNELKKRFEFYANQKKDIEKAREDILSVIDETNKTLLEMFLDTFMEIQKNFSRIFKQLFEGGDAGIELIDPENILDSGIEINVRPPGKKTKNINLLSGGERALTAIALLFATYMVRPSPFCFLDEIDAPLDAQNIGRFIKILKEFSVGTQFIIVTHSQTTMRIGESIYGITMEEPGVSKLVSKKISKDDTLD